MSTTEMVVRRSITVNASPQHAFAVFTEQLADWWPLETHSMKAPDGRPDTAIFEQRVGGRVYERTGDEEHLWGYVTAWEPPSRIGLDWRVNPKNPPTDIEVTFTPEGKGTRVEVVHSGWERFGENAQESFESYNGGWVPVLEGFRRVADEA